MILVGLALAGCGGGGSGADRAGNGQAPDGQAPEVHAPDTSTGQAASPPPPPDAGTAAGHGADARRVPVPEQDATPPQAVIGLKGRGGRTLAEATMPAGREHPRRVRVDETRSRATVVGRDADSGVARVRISIREVATCRAQDGALFRKPRTRYFPPPQVERIRAAPGFRLMTERRRARPLTLSRHLCGRGAGLVRLRGELWGEAINGLGLEAVTPHIPFEYRAGSS